MEQTTILKTMKRCLLVAAVFLLQFIFADKLRVYGVAPNFAFCFVLTLSFLKETSYSFQCALALGLLLDSVSGRLFGAYTVAFMTVAFFIREFYHSAFSENFLVEALYGLLISFVYSICYAFFISLFRGEFFALFSRTGWIELIYNYGIFLLMLLLQKRSLKKQKRRSMFRL